MAYVYRYIDLADNIIKYVGIVWSDNRTLKKRIMEHAQNDTWCRNRKWRIEYITEDITNRSEAEAFESHYISLFETDKYYNYAKADWGINRHLPKRNDWKVFAEDDIDQIELLNQKIDLLTKEICILKSMIEDASIVKPKLKPLTGRDALMAMIRENN